MARMVDTAANVCGMVVRALAITVLLTTSGASGGPPLLRGANQMNQVLVFDAGSSGTRIHVFNILPSDKHERAHVPKIDLEVRQRQTKKVKPGLSTFAETDDLTGAQQNIEELIEFANQFVPEPRRARTPALLKATAGLRAVQNKQAVKAVLESVRQTLADSGYSFRSEWADIIQGKEEGGLAWVAANYLEGNFEQEGGSLDKETLGVIELGGGSTQVTFQVEDKKSIAADDRFFFKTAKGKEYHVYAHSYLGYGQDYAQKHLLDSTSDDEDPCYPKGYERQGPPGASAVVKGTGNWQSCKANIQSRLLAAFNDAPGMYDKEIPLEGRFVATENFFYVQDGLKLKLEDNVVKLPQLDNALESTCKTTLSPTSEELAKMASGTANAGSPNTCFALSYQTQLLQNWQAFRQDVEVKIAHKINGGDVDWALGAALVHFVQGDTMQGASSFWLFGLLMELFGLLMKLFGLLMVMLVSYVVIWRGYAKYLTGNNFSSTWRRLRTRGPDNSVRSSAAAVLVTPAAVTATARAGF